MDTNQLLTWLAYVRFILQLFFVVFFVDFCLLIAVIA